MRVIISTKRKIRRPPSRAGRGRRFTIPRLIVIIAIIDMILFTASIIPVFQPVEAASPITEALPIGPAIFETANLPVMIPIKLTQTIFTVESVSIHV